MSQLIKKALEQANGILHTHNAINVLNGLRESLVRVGLHEAVVEDIMQQQTQEANRQNVIVNEAAKWIKPCIDSIN